MQIIWKNCGILLGKIVAFCLENLWRFTCSLIYTRIYISCVYAVISILQRSLLARHAERCMWRSHVSCPQADVSCTYGAFHAAEPRCFVVLFARGRGVKTTINVNLVCQSVSIQRAFFCRLEECVITHWQPT